MIKCHHCEHQINYPEDECTVTKIGNQEQQFPLHKQCIDDFIKASDGLDIEIVGTAHSSNEEMIERYGIREWKGYAKGHIACPECGVPMIHIEDIVHDKNMEHPNFPPDKEFPQWNCVVEDCGGIAVADRLGRTREDMGAEEWEKLTGGTYEY